MTSKSIRRAQKAYRINPSKLNLDVILRSQERLATQHEIDQHIQSGLLKTLANEKKRRKRHKKLGLVGDGDTGAQLFHSSKVQAAKAFAAEKEAKEQAEKAEKEAKKAQVTENKLQKDVKAQEKAVQRQLDKESRAQEKAEKLATKEATKEQAKLQKKNKKQSELVVLPPEKTPACSTKAVSFAKHVEVVEQEEGPKMVVTRSRHIRLPLRFQH